MRALRIAGRVALLAALLAGIAVVISNRALLEPGALRAAIDGEPALAPLLFVLAHVAASLLFVPRTLMALVAGLAFGVVGGIVWATAGNVAGAVAGFLVARYLNSGLLDPEAMPRFGPVLLRVERGGWRAVAVLRLVPLIPHTVSNYALGLTKISLGAYTLGSLAGQLPMTVAYVDLGAAGERVLAGKAGWVEPTVIGLAALGISLVLSRLMTRRDRSAP